MSDDDATDISAIDITQEFEKAEQMLAVARKAREVDISTATIVNYPTLLRSGAIAPLTR